MFSQDCCTTFIRVSRKSRIVNSPKFHVDRFATLARMSYDSRMTVLRNILAKKKRIKFLNMFKTFANSSRHMKISTKLVRMSCKNPRLNSQNSREKFGCH